MKNDDGLPPGIDIEDSLDDARRRALLKRIARAGAAVAPVSVLLLDSKQAMANTGSTPPFD